MPEFLRRLSLRIVLGLMFGALALTLLSVSIGGTVAALRDITAARHVLEVGEADRDMLAANQVLRVERGTSLVALSTPGDISRVVADVPRLRRISRDSLAHGLALLPKLGMAELAGRLAEADRRLEAARAKVDVELGATKPARDPAISGLVNAASLAELDLLADAQDRVDVMLRQLDPVLSPLVDAKRALWIARVKYGLASITASAAVSARRNLTPAELRADYELRAAADQAWTLGREIAASMKAPRLAAALAVAQAEYLGGPTAATREAVLASLRAGQASSVDPEAASEGSKIPVLGAVAEAALADLLERAQASADAAWARLVPTVGALGLAILLGAGGLWVAFRHVSGPIRSMTLAMRRLADGDLTTAVPFAARRDEIGAMAGAVQVFKDNARRTRDMEAEQTAARARRAAEDARVRADAEQAAAAEAATLVVGSIGAGLARLAMGDLTFRLETPLPAAYEKLRADFNAASGQLRDLVGAIAQNIDALRGGTGEITQASDDLSRRTEQQAASLEQTAAAMDTIMATVRRTADGAKRAHDVVARSRAEAEQSGDVVRDAVAAMGKIEQSSRQIEQITGAINEIAFQTNLLALNAGVEAARAGDAGRGFAVVASEVRALAQRSADAAREIKALIAASGQQVSEGVVLVGKTGAALSRIVEHVGAITTEVADIASSAQEQARGLAEVNTAVGEMDRITQQNAAMVEQSTAATHQIAHDAEALAQLTSRFKTTAERAAQPLPSPGGHGDGASRRAA